MAEAGEIVTPAWWLSWYSPAPLEAFELHSPWWVSGWTGDGETPILVAAVRADSPESAWSAVCAAYDDPPDAVEQRFCDLMPEGTNPFSDRFPMASWMAWGEDGSTCACPTHSGSDEHD